MVNPLSAQNTLAENIFATHERPESPWAGSTCHLPTKRWPRKWGRRIFPKEPGMESGRLPTLRKRCRELTVRGLASPKKQFALLYHLYTEYILLVSLVAPRFSAR